MGKFTKAVYLSETDMAMIADELLNIFIEEYVDEYYDEETDKIVLNKEQIKDLYNEFVNFVEAQYENILYNEEAEMMIAYIDERCREMNNGVDFRWIIENILGIEKPEDLISLIKDTSDYEIEIK